MSIIINYFNQYPLRTTKKDSFERWCEIYNIMINKEHLTLTGFEKIKILAKAVNNNPFNISQTENFSLKE